MGQCNVLREELSSKGADFNSILTADSDNDLRVTEKEFTEFCNTGSRKCSGSPTAVWKVVLALQAKPYWKSKEVRSDFMIGEHAYFNGGWRELVFSYGSWQFPWRKTTLDTIRQSVYKMSQVMAPLDHLLSVADKIGIKEVQAVGSCTPKLTMSNCAKSWLSYNQIPGQASADPVMDTKSSSVAGGAYTYPTSINIPDSPNPLFSLALCLIERDHVSEEEMRMLMGCGSDAVKSSVSMLLLLVVVIGPIHFITGPGMTLKYSRIIAWFYRPLFPPLKFHL